MCVIKSLSPLKIIIIILESKLCIWYMLWWLDQEINKQESISVKNMNNSKVVLRCLLHLHRRREVYSKLPKQRWKQRWKLEPTITDVGWTWHKQGNPPSLHAVLAYLQNKLMWLQPYSTITSLFSYKLFKKKKSFFFIRLKIKRKKI